MGRMLFEGSYLQVASWLLNQSKKRVKKLTELNINESSISIFFPYLNIRMDPKKNLHTHICCGAPARGRAAENHE